MVVLMADEVIVAKNKAGLYIEKEDRIIVNTLFVSRYEEWLFSASRSSKAHNQAFHRIAYAPCELFVGLPGGSFG